MSRPWSGEPVQPTAEENRKAARFSSLTAFGTAHRQRFHLGITVGSCPLRPAIIFAIGVFGCVAGTGLRTQVVSLFACIGAGLCGSV
jgi:hypothetical protein